MSVGEMGQPPLAGRRRSDGMVLVMPPGRPPDPLVPPGEVFRGVAAVDMWAWRVKRKAVVSWSFILEMA